MINRSAQRINSTAVAATLKSFRNISSAVSSSPSFSLPSSNNVIITSVSPLSNSSTYLQGLKLSTQSYGIRSINTGNLQFQKQSSPEYHRHSTAFAYSQRDVLDKIEKEFQMPVRYDAKNFSDRVAKVAVKSLRVISNMFFKEKYIHYACLLETVAAVPGMAGGMLQHLKSLRTCKNNFVIKTLLDEAENERMHLMTFIELTQPTISERVLIAAAQGGYLSGYLLLYILSPKTAHRFVGYLEEEAVITYTNMLRDLDAGLVKNVDAPPIAKAYWGLPDDSKLRDVIMVIRQDEVEHASVNHNISNSIATENVASTSAKVPPPTTSTTVA